MMPLLLLRFCFLTEDSSVLSLLSMAVLSYSFLLDR